MTGPFGTTAGPWLTSGTLVYALDERETVNRFTARIEGGYEIKSSFQKRATSSDETAANAKAIAQVPAMLALVDAVADWVNIEDVRDMARAIVRELEGE